MAISSSILELKAEWNRICNSMNRGSWHGSEKSAIDAIEDIKRKIQAIESTPMNKGIVVTYYAKYRMHGESHIVKASNPDKLQELIFGQAYAPSHESVTYWQQGVAS